MRTYKINVHASALRTMKVRAATPEQAVELAAERAERSASGQWVIDFPGEWDEHFMVTGPDGELILNLYADEEEE
jgi:hypothetical protein